MSAPATSPSASDSSVPLELVLPWPPSVNHIWRQRRARRGAPLLSAEAREYKRRVGALGLLHPRWHARGPVTVALELLPPDRRRRDLDNVLKLVFDALQWAGFYGDDAQIDRLSVQRLGFHPGGCVRVVLSESRAPTLTEIERGFSGTRGAMRTRRSAA